MGTHTKTLQHEIPTGKQRQKLLHNINSNKLMHVAHYRSSTALAGACNAYHPELATMSATVAPCVIAACAMHHYCVAAQYPPAQEHVPASSFDSVLRCPGTTMGGHPQIIQASYLLESHQPRSQHSCSTQSTCGGDMHASALSPSSPLAYQRASPPPSVSCYEHAPTATHGFFFGKMSSGMSIGLLMGLTSARDQGTKRVAQTLSKGLKRLF